MFYPDEDLLEEDLSKKGKLTEDERLLFESRVSSFKQKTFSVQQHCVN